MFLITSESVENPIFRYDLIEHLVTTTNDSKTFYALMSTFPHIPSERADTVALIIKKVTEIRDLLGDLKVIKRTIIPSNSIVKVNCKKNFEFETKEKSVIFQPSIDSQADKILEFKKSYETTRKGKTPHVSIYITNLSNRKIVLQRGGDIFGTLHNISAVTPIPISKDIDIHEISQEVHIEKENWQHEVELPDLT